MDLTVTFVTPPELVFEAQSFIKLWLSMRQPAHVTAHVVAWKILLAFFNVLQSVHLSNLVFAVHTDTSNCVDLNKNNYWLQSKKNTVKAVGTYCHNSCLTRKFVIYKPVYTHISNWLIHSVILCELIQLENVKKQIIVSGGSPIGSLGAVPHLKYNSNIIVM